MNQTKQTKIGFALFGTFWVAIAATAAHAQTAKPPAKKPVPPAAKKPVVAPPAAPPTVAADAAEPTDGVRLVPPGGLVYIMGKDAVSPNGRLVAVSGRDNSVLVYEVATGRLVRSFPAPGMAWCVQMLPDNDRVIAGDAENYVSVWSVRTGKRLLQFSLRPTGYTGYSAIKSVAVSPDGKIGAVVREANQDNALHLFNMKTGKPLGLDMRYDVVPSSVLFAPDGTLLAEGKRTYTEAGTSPIVVLDPATGKTLRTIQSAGTPLAFSPDKKRLFTSSVYLTADRNDRRGKAFWFDFQTGTKEKEFADLGTVDGITPSGDGTRFSTYAKSLLREFSAETGELIREISTNGKLPQGTAYAPTGELLTAVFGGSLKYLRFANGQEVTGGGGGNLNATPRVLSDDGRLLYFVTGDTNAKRLTGWDVLRNVPVGPPLTRNGDFYSPSISPKSRFVAASVGDQLTVWETQNSRVVGSAKGNTTGKPTFTSDETTVAVAAEESLVELSTATGQSRTYVRPKPTDGGDMGKLHAVLYLPDNKRVVAGDDEGRVYVFDRMSGSLLSQGIIHLSIRLSGANSSAGATWGTIKSMKAVPGEADRFVFQGNLGYTGEYDLATHRIVRTFTDISGPDATAIGIAPDGKTVAVGLESGVIVLLDRATGKETGQLTGHSGGVFDVGFSPDGARSTSLGRDGAVRVFDMARKEALITSLVFFAVNDDGQPVGSPEWMVYDRAGFFEGSEGATRRVHFADGAQTFSADQFYERYYRAGLLASTLGGVSGGSGSVVLLPVGPNASEAIRNGAPPLVKIVSPQTGQAAQAGTVEVTIEATEQAKGGVKVVRLYHNGRLVGGPTSLRGIGVEAASGTTTTKRFTVALESGTNELKAVAYSNTDLESAPAVARVTFALASVAKPALHVLAVGINTYKDASMNLAYARPDADSLADVFDTAKGGKGAGALFSSVQVARLLDADATGAAILAGINRLSATKPEDVVLIYLAGHGETADNAWYFLPAEMRQMALPERVKELGIPWPTIEVAVGKIPARKIVLVVDACKSGAIVSGVRGGVGEQQALAIMARAQGIHILTASNGQQYAGEVKTLGHGILTYALLEGLSGKAGQSGDAAIMVRDVMSYVENRVPELSLKYRGEAQYPTPLARGQNFPMAGRQ